MTEEERAALARIELALGETCAVGEVEMCQLLWPLEASAALAKPGGEHSKEMGTLRRRVRDIILSLRVGYRSAILDSVHGYFVACGSDEVERFCQSRRRRAMSSLVIQSIVRKAQPLEDGIQLLMEFLGSQEEISRKIAKRQGKTYAGIKPEQLVAAVAEKAKGLADDGAGTAT
jgi:hypothetical protein